MIRRNAIIWWQRKLETVLIFTKSDYDFKDHTLFETVGTTHWLVPSCVLCDRQEPVSGRNTENNRIFVCTAEVWELISNFIPRLIRHVITYPCWEVKPCKYITGCQYNRSKQPRVFRRSTSLLVKLDFCFLIFFLMFAFLTLVLNP